MIWHILRIIYLVGSIPVLACMLVRLLGWNWNYHSWCWMCVLQRKLLGEKKQ